MLSGSVANRFPPLSPKPSFPCHKNTPSFASPPSPRTRKAHHQLMAPSRRLPFLCWSTRPSPSRTAVCITLSQASAVIATNERISVQTGRDQFQGRAPPTGSSLVNPRPASGTPWLHRRAYMPHQSPFWHCKPFVLRFLESRRVLWKVCGGDTHGDTASLRSLGLRRQD